MGKCGGKFIADRTKKKSHIPTTAPQGQSLGNIIRIPRALGDMRRFKGRAVLRHDVSKQHTKRLSGLGQPSGESHGLVGQKDGALLTQNLLRQTLAGSGRRPNATNFPDFQKNLRATHRKQLPAKGTTTEMVPRDRGPKQYGPPFAPSWRDCRVPSRRILGSPAISGKPHVQAVRSGLRGPEAGDKSYSISG